MLSPTHRLADRHAALLATVLLTAIASGSCAASSALRRGAQAEQIRDYDRAVAEYTKALRLAPDDLDARLALDRAKLRAADDHFQRGRRLAAVGRYQEALVEYQLAAELNPGNGDIDAQLRETRNQLRSKILVSREGVTELEALIDRARSLPPPGLDLPQDVNMPASLVFSEASSRLVFQAIAKMANISLAFDPTFRESPVTVDLRNASLERALQTVADTTRTFFRVTAPRTVLVIPDTPAKRREYEEEVVQTFYLSNADVKETMDLLRIVLDARRISPITANNGITIKDTPERISAAARVLAAIDKARPEVIIDVELLEVDRSRIQEYGLQIASPTAEGAPTGLNGSVTVPNPMTLQSLLNLSQSDILLGNLPGLYYRLLKTDSATRTLASPQIRTAEGNRAEARFGERVPIPVVTFAPIAQGGTPQQPITSFNYETIGVNIEITPRTHHDDDVTLSLRITVQNVSGTGFGGLPTFGNREIVTQIRLRDGETSMLAGLIRDEERKTVNGIPGLSDLPVVGRIFGHTRTETDQTDIILTLTPHIIRVLDVAESDLRAFKVARDSLSPASDLPLPVPLELPRADEPARPPQPPPAEQQQQPPLDRPATPAPATPILPPPPR
jgi:general secretion pathway protein D